MGNTISNEISSSIFSMQKLRAELECRICSKLFKEPKLLPCGHICCAACVRGLIEAAAKQPVQSITCPQCHEEVQVPADGQFPTVFAVKNMISHWKEAEAQGEEANDDKMQIGQLKLRVANEAYVEENVPCSIFLIVLGGDPQKQEEVPLRQLDVYLNEHADRRLSKVTFKFVKFDEQLVQMLRRIKRERFEDIGINWRNCDFSGISKASFHLLLDDLLCPNTICMADWIGMPAGHNYNTLYKLKAFQDAKSIHYKLDKPKDQKTDDDVDYDDELDDALYPPPPLPPNVINLQLEADVLIDFLHSPGYRKLKFVDGHLQNGFDAFLERLIERFNGDKTFQRYEVHVLMLNATAKTKALLEIGKALILPHPKANIFKLKLELMKPANRWRIPNYDSYNKDNVFEFRGETIME